MSDTPSQVPEKAPGQAYRLVLRGDSRIEPPGFASPGSTGRWSYPSVDFGPNCTCCDAPSSRTLDVLPPTERGHPRTGVRIPVPVCAECSEHIEGPPTPGGYVRFVLGLVVLFVANLVAYVGARFGWIEDVPSWLPAVLVAGFVGFLAANELRLSSFRKAHLARGHHTPIRFQVAPGRTTIWTTNRRLVLDLVARCRSADPTVS